MNFHANINILFIYCFVFLINNFNNRLESVYNTSHLDWLKDPCIDDIIPMLINKVKGLVLCLAWGGNIDLHSGLHYCLTCIWFVTGSKLYSSF